MTTELTKFDFKGREIRIADREGNPWFIAKDVCEVLDLDSSNISRNGFLDDDEKALCTVQAPGGPQEMTIISESGLSLSSFGAASQRRGSSNAGSRTKCCRASARREATRWTAKEKTTAEFSSWPGTNAGFRSP